MGETYIDIERVRERWSERERDGVREIGRERKGQGESERGTG